MEAAPKVFYILSSPISYWGKTALTSWMMLLRRGCGDRNLPSLFLIGAINSTNQFLYLVGVCANGITLRYRGILDEE